MAPKIPASVRHLNPGAQWPGPVAKKWGSTGFEILKDGQRNRIATFPTWEQGGAAHIDLLRTRYAGMPLWAAVKKWSGGNHWQTYTQRVARDTGLKPTSVINDELLRSPAGLALVKSMAGHEKGPNGEGISDDHWARAHAMVFNGAPPPVAGTDTNMPKMVNAPAAAASGPVVQQQAPGGVSKKAFNAAMARALLNTQLTANPTALEGISYALAKGVGAYAAMGERQSEIDRESALRESLSGAVGDDPLMQAYAQSGDPATVAQFIIQDKKTEAALARETARLQAQEDRADSRSKKQLESQERIAQAALDKEEAKFRFQQMGEANDPKNVEVSRQGAYEIHTNKVTGEVRKFRNGKLIEHTPGIQPVVPGAGAMPATGVTMQPMSLDGTMPPRVGPTVEAAAAGQLPGPDGVINADYVPPPQQAAGTPPAPAAPTPAPNLAPAPSGAPSPVAAPPGAQPASADLASLYPGLTPGENGALMDQLGYYNIKPKVDGEATPEYLLRGRHLYSTHNDAWKMDYEASLAQDKEIGSAIRKASENWRRMKPNVQAVEESIKSGVYTGKGGDLVQSLRKIAEAAGLVNANDTDAAVIDAMSNRFVPAIREGLPGSVSNYEMQAYLKSVVNLGNTPAANYLLMHFMKRAGEINEREAKLAEKFRAMQRKAGVPAMLDGDGFSQFLADSYEKEPVFDERSKQLMTLATNGADVATLAKFAETGELPEPKGAPSKKAYSDGTMPQPVRGSPNAAPAAPKVSVDGTMPKAEQFPGAPPVGTVVDGHVYLGGDPSKSASWRAK